MIKKIICGFALIASMVACTEDYTDWAAPQHNDQPNTVAFNDGKITETAVIDYANLEDGQTQVQVCQITAPTASDNAYAPSYSINIGGADYDLSAEGLMSADDLKLLIETTYGKAPEVRDIPATVSMWLSNGTQAIKTATSGEFKVHAKLEAPEIYPHLYLIGAPSEWDPTCTKMPFTRNESVSVYDDPVFTVMFPVADGDTWFAFADDKTVQTNEWSNVFGTREGNGKNFVGEKGHFARRCELDAECGDGSFMVSVNGDAKFIKMTVNVLEGTYLIEKVNFVDYIYLPGNAQGWNPGTAAALQHVGDGVYKGFAVMDGEFKFTQERAWAAEYNNGSFKTCSPEFSLGAMDGGNISFTGSRGLYYFTVDVVNGDLSAVRVDKMGLIGDFNGWGSDDEMTWNDAELCFEKTGATVTKSGWKFRMNGDWAVNFGGDDLNNLQPDGANIAVVGSTIKFYPCRTTSNNIYCTIQ